ncbi:MAG: sugar phosphate isomerase/epimerase family protein [Promethearchaeota archaeon]
MSKLIPCINHATMMKTPLEEFLIAVKKAGFNAVELRRDQTFDFLKSNSIEDLNRILINNNIKVATWNAIELFSLCPENEFKFMCDYTERLMKIGNKIGCDTIIAVPSFIDQSIFPKDQIFEKTVERFQFLRKIAEKYNFKMGFEPLGFQNCSVRKIKDSLKIIKAVEEDGLPPSGLVIDTFHFFTGNHKPEDLRLIPKEKLWLIHMDDAVKKPLNELKDSDRVFPGEGFFELDNFIKILKEINYKGYLSLELFNEKYWERDPILIAQKSFESLQKFLY